MGDATDFSSSPHLTVVSNFNVPNVKMEEFRQKLGLLLPWFLPMELDFQASLILGKDRDIPASLVESTDENSTVRDFHKSTLDLVRDLGGSTDEHFSGFLYTPHISHWEGIFPMQLHSAALIEHTEGFGKGIRLVEIFKF